MDRLEELQKIFKNIDEEIKTTISFSLEELIFMEKELTNLKKYPFILYNKRTGETRVTGAGKRYKEIQQSYLNCLKILMSVLRNSDSEEEDEFDKWVKEQTSFRE